MMRLTATSAMLIFFNLATVPFGWAFDWNNKTWKDSGCPNNFQGIWIARESQDHPAQIYRVTDNIISYQSSGSIESSHQYQVILKEGQYFILKISPDNLQELIFAMLHPTPERRPRMAQIIQFLETHIELLPPRL